MKHAGEAALGELSPLLEEIRRRPGLQERKPGIFYDRGRARLHFHEDETGLFADLKVGADWVRLDVSAQGGRNELLRLLDGPSRA